MFIGVTSIDATYDRVATPYGQGRIPGVEVHAQLFETLERGQFLTDAFEPRRAGLLRRGWRSRRPDLCVSLRLAGLYRGRRPADRRDRHAISLLPPRHRASVLRAVRLGLAYGHRRRQLSALCGHGGALRRAETERHHYQQAIHFVTHEMRTPLTAIQGSSELMGRYNLNEEKRKQIAR